MQTLATALLAFAMILLCGAAAMMLATINEIKRCMEGREEREEDDLE